MRYDAEIRVFDMLSDVHIRARVWSTDGLSHEPPQTVLEETYSVPGVGTDCPEEWLRDALIFLLEAT